MQSFIFEYLNLNLLFGPPGPMTLHRQVSDGSQNWTSVPGTGWQKIFFR